MPHICKHDAETLKQLQSLPLRQKVFETRQRIAEWVKHWGEDGVYVAFSGGKDSTVLLDIVRRDYHDVPAVFCDTGLEFPEIREFVKTINNVAWIKPRMPFNAVLEKYGFPVVSKTTAQKLSRLSNPDISERHKFLLMGGITEDGRKSRYRLADKWKYLLNAPFKISDKCCDIMKKEPAKRYERENGNPRPMLGMMAADSKAREEAWLDTGCNAFDLGRPQSNPLGFWLESDIWEYVARYNVPVCRVYSMGYDRTGCIFCAFGCHKEGTPNRFQRMHDTHPKQWKYCMDKLGMRDVLEFCGIPVEDKQLKLDLGD